MISPTIVESPALFPQQCVCRSHGGPYMDLGVEVGDDTAAGFRGRRLYLCQACQHAVARTAGWISPEDAEALRAQLEAAAEEIEQLTESVAEARAARVVPIEQVKHELGRMVPGGPKPPLEAA